MAGEAGLARKRRSKNAVEAKKLWVRFFAALRMTNGGRKSRLHDGVGAGGARGSQKRNISQRTLRRGKPRQQTAAASRRTPHQIARTSSGAT
jgi:hypothetical protein